MEILQGKQPRVMAAPELARLRAAYEDVLVDLGTGDGRFVLHAARREPRSLAIGLDACRENLRDGTRSAPPNALFVIANACALPAELTGLAARVTINFPWGSLRDGLLGADAALLDGLWALAQPGARLEARLNASALAEAGWDLAAGGAQVARALEAAGFSARPPRRLTPADLRDLPSTWAKRLAFGRAPEAVLVEARKGARRAPEFATIEVERMRCDGS